MKTDQLKTFRRIAIAVAAGSAGAVGLVACGGGTEPTVALVPTTPPTAALASAAKYLVTVRDAATGALVTDATTVSFSGAGVVNLDNAAVTSLTVRDGTAAFGTAPNVSAGSRLTIRTQSRAAGWSDGSATVDVTASGAVRVIDILVTNSRNVAALNASAVPIVAAAAPAPTTNGVVAATVAATTPAKTVTNVTGVAEVLAPAGVSIPAGVRITNAAGQPPAGTLTLSITSPSTAAAEGLAAIPGGARTAEGRPVRVAGMVTTTLQDAAGNRFTRFSSPVTVQMPLAAGTRRADRSGPLLPGDSFPVSVWNETTGRWDAGPAGVVKAVGGGLVLEFQTASFSTRAALDPIDPANPPEGSLRCNTGSVLLTGWPPTISDDDTVDVYVTRQGFTWPAWTRYSFGQRMDNEWRVPLTDDLFLPGESRAATILVRRSSDQSLLAEVPVADYCAQNTVTMQWPAIPPGSIEVRVTESCPDGSGTRPVRTTVTGNRPPIGADLYSRTLSGYTDADGRVVFRGLPSSNISYDFTAEGTRGRADKSSLQILILGNTTSTVGTTIDFEMACANPTGS
jgi:hypothetical protein